MTPTLLTWLQLIGIIALEIGVLAGMGTLLQRLTQSAPWRRTLWQTCLVATVALLVIELSGVARHPFAWQDRSVQPTSIVSTKPFPALPPNARLSEEFRSQVREKAALKHLNRSSLSVAPMGLITTPQVQKPVQASSLVTRATHGEVSATDSFAILCFGLLWLTGITVVLGRTVLCRSLFFLLRHKWRNLSDTRLHESVRILAGSLEIHRGLRLIESDHFTTPIAFGVLRPTVGLPAQFTTKFNRAEQEAMLLHELAHLLAHDPLWYLLADIITALLWWHPFTWWMRRQLHAASEIAADEASLLLTNGPSVLAECLVTLGARLTQPAPFGSLGVAGTGFRSGLGRRVERLIQLHGQTWTPPCPRRSIAARSLGPIALVIIAILSIAWAVPPALTKGENMQTMKQTWKRSLAAFALLATFGSDHSPALANEPTPKLDGRIIAPVATSTTRTPGASATVAASTQISPDASTDLAAAYEGAFPAPARSISKSKERQLIETKLNRITLDQVQYDGLPLVEVINNLVELCAARDPEKAGINFVLNRENPTLLTAGPVDPTTGLPNALASAQPVDLSSVTVKVQPALKHVRLIDVLEVITKTADQPIKYSIEDYGVVFSVDTSKLGVQPTVVLNTTPLEVRTFRVDTNTFFAGMESAFGIKSGNAKQPQEIQVALRKLLEQLGINLNVNNKSIFYNELTGILMVRGTAEDLALVAAAIETLGGAPHAPGMALVTPGFSVTPTGTAPTHDKR